MVELANLASTLLMGLFLVVVGGALVRFGARRAAPAVTGATEGSVTETLTRVVHSEVTWMLGFLVLVVGFGAAAVLFLSSPELAAQMTVVLVVAFGAVFVGATTITTYKSLRGAGRPRSEAVFVSAFALMVLVAVGIAANLVVS